MRRISQFVKMTTNYFYQSSSKLTYFINLLTKKNEGNSRAYRNTIIQYDDLSSHCRLCFLNNISRVYLCGRCLPQTYEYHPPDKRIACVAHTSLHRRYECGHWGSLITTSKRAVQCEDHTMLCCPNLQTVKQILS